MFVIRAILVMLKWSVSRCGGIKLNRFLGFCVLLKVAHIQCGIVTDFRDCLLVTCINSYFTCSMCVHKHASMWSVLTGSFWVYLGQCKLLAIQIKEIKTRASSIARFQAHRKWWDVIVQCAHSHQHFLLHKGKKKARWLQQGVCLRTSNGMHIACLASAESLGLTCAY